MEAFNAVTNGHHYESRIRTLSLRNNRLASLDLEPFPQLQNLHIDGNAVASITGLDGLPRIESVSWREQRTTDAPDARVMLRGCDDLSSLCLSRNRFHHVPIPTVFANLRHLELASAGLEALDADFGQNLPNLRSLNLNFNAIRDLSPLLGIGKLHKLWLAGNRVSRLRRTALVLKDVGPELAELDLRNNILTVGFYTPSEGIGHHEMGLVRPSTSGSHPEHRWEDSREEHPDEGLRRQSLLAAVPGDTDRDARERLDADTALRRRVYEMMVRHSCPRMRSLDGLEVGRHDMAAPDRIRDRLVELGIFPGHQSD